MRLKKYTTLIILLISIVPTITLALDRSSFYQKSVHRLALVIGNSEYYGGNYIKQPVNDARDLAKVLRKVGFEVILRTDLTNKKMKAAVNRFTNQLYQQKGIGFFYFSGHGLQENGENYLMAIDAKEWHKEIKLSELLEELNKTGNQTNIVILDACRDTPQRTRNWFNSDKLIGLATPPFVPSTLVAYAAKSGQKAFNCVLWDCSDRNSPYVKQLMKWIQKPNLSINEVLRKVRLAVQKETNGRQSPGYYDELNDDFFFKQVLNPIHQHANRGIQETPEKQKLQLCEGVPLNTVVEPRVQRFLGCKMLKILATPERVTSFRVSPKKNLKLPQKNRLGAYPIKKFERHLTKQEIKGLQKLFFSENSYNFEKKKRCIFHPDMGLHFVKNKQSVEVLFSFSCNLWQFVHQNKEKLEDFDPVRQKLRTFYDSVRE
jgi:hypothetical protein